MEILGIGPLELLLIALIAIVVLGPKEMKNLGRKIAEWLRKLRSSEIWSTTKDVMDTPSRILRETGLEEELRQMRDLGRKMDAPFWAEPPGWTPGNAPLPSDSDAGEEASPGGETPNHQLDENA